MHKKTKRNADNQSEILITQHQKQRNGAQQNDKAMRTQHNFFFRELAGWLSVRAPLLSVSRLSARAPHLLVD